MRIRARNKNKKIRTKKMNQRTNLKKLIINPRTAVKAKADETANQKEISTERIIIHDQNHIKKTDTNIESINPLILVLIRSTTIIEARAAVKEDRKNVLALDPDPSKSNEMSEIKNKGKIYGILLRKTFHQRML